MLSLKPSSTPTALNTAYRIWLSPPDVTPEDLSAIHEALASGWVAPAGPHLDAFEARLAEHFGVPEACATHSGTAALHLAMLALGIGPGDSVVCGTHTFIASVNPIRYVGATPVLIESGTDGYHFCPYLLAEYLKSTAQNGRLPKAVIFPHLYGLAGPVAAVRALCDQYGIWLVEDAAESLGSSIDSQLVGSYGHISILSFNGNKLVTTSGGGAILSADAACVQRARHLAGQARVAAPHYEHSEVGYNYRLSNVLAALGLSQFLRLETKVLHRRKVWLGYQQRLGNQPGFTFRAEAPGTYSSRWLTTLHIDAEVSGTTRDAVAERLRQAGIESRPVWKPMHLQTPYQACELIKGPGNSPSEAAFATGLCLPSGYSLNANDLDFICNEILAECRA